MTDAYIETTTLTDLLLKKDGSEKAAARAINLFSRPIIPQFAWKEFKRGIPREREAGMGQSKKGSSRH
jgi:hypothetical protein